MRLEARENGDGTVSIYTVAGELVILYATRAEAAYLVAEADRYEDEQLMRKEQAHGQIL